ncbi:SH3 domain-containing protein [Noviherbaspirillum galbum]|uniref:SH3 domain-containing protein n=1 Tax=Noviherbaspirillum galbum TaxID=2709383 RepID=A0A6B3SWX3_9BURK|nr:SH3 domain-containing protein [Noviherbaspirillum galbum]NEX62932.1 hypothetical protein [Noviherbaspirillum galbum]
MRRAPIWVMTLALAAGLAQAESAVTTRAAELQSLGQADSDIVARLPENTRVEVMARQGAWRQVKTGAGQSGWVRMLSLRPENAIAAPAPAGGASGAMNAINGLLTAGRTSNTATVTTGVRGLSEEDLQRAQANPAEFEKLQRFGTDRNAAQDFAQRSRLTPARVDYLGEPAQSGLRKMEGG